MTDTAIGGGNKPLDIKLLQNVVVDEECPQLEFVVDDDFIERPPAERKHKKLSQYDLEEKIKRFRKHVSQLQLPDRQTKLYMKLAEFEQELRIRKIEQEKLEEEQEAKAEERERLPKVAPASTKAFETKAASKLDSNGGVYDVSEEPERRVIRTRATTLRKMVETLAKADSTEKANKGCAGSGSPYSEEIDHVYYPAKGKGPSLPSSRIPEDAFYDRVKSKTRLGSGEQAGPSSRQGLRSGQFKACHACSRMVSPTNLLSIGTGSDCALYCPSCSQKQFPRGGSHLLSSKHRKPDDSAESSDDVCVKKCGGVKRRRRTPDDEKPAGSVVELFSSDDEDKDLGDVNAVLKPLHVEQQKGYSLRNTNARRMEDVKLAYPSKDDPEAVEVDYQDLQRLNPMEFLNDTVIDFYIKYMQRPEFLKPEQKKRFHFFNSFFYKKLYETATSQVSKKQSPDLSKLRKWTKGTNIFEKDYLFVPVHEKWHWSLAIVCNPGADSLDSGSDRCILHLDSMNPGHKSAGVFRMLKMYLVAEWAHQAEEDGNGGSCQSISPDDFSTKKVQVPQQDNESDCGLFLLHYIQCFLQEAPSKFKLRDLDQGNLFGRNWFKPSKASQLRKEIRDLLEGLFDACGAQDSHNKEPIEKTAVLHENSANSPCNALQVGGHDPDYSGVAPEAMQVLRRATERSEYAHSPGQSSTEYVSVESSPSPDFSTHNGSQHGDGSGLIGNEIDPGDFTSGHPTGWESGKATSGKMEPDYSHFIMDESLQVYVELGDVREMDQSELKKVDY